MNLLATLYTAASMVLTQIPDPEPVQPPGTEGFTLAISWVKWIAFALAGIAIVIVAIRMFFQSRRGEAGETVGTLGWILFGVILIGGGVGIVTALMGA